MKAFCINMKEAAARREHCEKEFAREGVDATFIRGFNGRASKLQHEAEWITKQVGACISHYMAIEEIRHNKMGPTLVLEDDVKLPESFMFKLRGAIHALPEDWDVAALSWFVGTQCSANWSLVNEHWQTFTKGDVWGQAAYLVNGSKGAERILNCIHPVYSHIDRMFWENCRDDKMKGYFSIQQLVHQTWDFESQNI